jgi:hypothetical protein
MHELICQELFRSQTEHFTTRLAASRDWAIHQVTYPVIDVTFTAPGRTSLRVRAMCDGWNGQPPSFDLLTAAGVPLRVTQPPPIEIFPNPTGVFNCSPHPNTGRPFVCSRGAREYHVHPSHINDLWENLRGQSDFDLGGLLTRLWHAWLKGAG